MYKHTHTLLELINKLKLQDTKSTYKVMFLYANSELSRKKIKKTILIYNSTKENKILRNKLNQEDERFVH